MLKNLLNVLFPEFCYGCNQLLIHNNTPLCIKCLYDLSVFSNIKTTPIIPQNTDLKIANYWNLFPFEKNGIVQQIIHHLKYNNKPELGRFIVDYLAESLRNELNTKEIDLIVPVPLYKKKQKQRGYNQLDLFGKKLANLIEAQYNNNLLTKKKSSKSQTRKNSNERNQLNERNLYQLSKHQKLNNTHILLIDDVLTTGNTIRQCLNALRRIPNVKLSVLTIAHTQKS